MDDITRIIKHTRDAYDATPYEINDGQCEVFMQDIVDEAPRAEECCTGFVLANEYLAYPVHVWIFYEGQHYDAECASGVDDFLDLPFFRNQNTRNTVAAADLHNNRFTEHTSLQ